jgi:hypothetical protein
VTFGAEGEPAVRYLELLGGSSLTVQAKGASLRLVDGAGADLDIGAFLVVKDTSITLRKFPVPATDRYFVVVEPAGAAKASLKVSVSLASSWTGTTPQPALDVPFTAPPGAVATITVKPADGLNAAPAVLGLTDCDGTNAFPAGKLRTKPAVASFRSAPLAGGDCVARIGSQPGSPGAVEWRITLRLPKKNAFALEETPAGE